MRPILAITLGDPAGIGPEITAACLARTVRDASPILFGHWPTLEREFEKTGLEIPISLHDEPVVPDPGHATAVHCGPWGPPIVAPSPKSARSQFDALERAVDAVLEDRCDALVTAPVAKSAVATVNPGFTGHTEYLAARSGRRDDDVTMIFASAALAVGLVSTHLPLRSAAAALTRPRLERTVSHLLGFLSLRRLDRPPRIAVSALNPHAGEQGLLGFEEQEILEPFCRALSERPDVRITGPVPADALYRDAFAGRYDAVVAAYHDQAMIPLKLLGPGRVVNVTWGLPFIRTSPDHGVAYDVARKNLASPDGMALAVELAIELVRSKNSL